jgi:membrane protein
MKTFINEIKELIARVQRVFWIKFIIDVFARFGRDKGGLLAAGLAFFLILAFVPLFLVGLWFLGHLYANRPDEALYEIKAHVIPQIVPNGGANREVFRFMAQAHIASPDGRHAGPALLKILNGHGLAGLLGILTAIWAAMQIFVNGSSAMNAAWETQEKRNWFVLRGVALGLLVGTGVLLVFSLGATAISTHISHSSLAHIIPFEGVLLSALAEVLAVIISAVMYAAVYKFLPSIDVPWKSAFAGAIFAAVTWEVAKKALAVYLLKPNTSLYGDLGNLIVFILWILYSMTILLLGAEVSALYAREVEKAPIFRLRKTAEMGASTPPVTSASHTQTHTHRARRTAGRGGGPHAKR